MKNAHGGDAYDGELLPAATAPPRSLLPRSARRRLLLLLRVDAAGPASPGRPGGSGGSGHTPSGWLRSSSGSEARGRSLGPPLGDRTHADP
jgi:hypothetical protein